MLTNPVPGSPLLSLPAYLEASRSKYDACLTHVDHAHTVPGATANVRLHHVRFDGNGEPKFGALVRVLFDHVIYYCVASLRRPKQLTADEWGEFHRIARSYFRQIETSGEAGEILLYLLLEAVLGAPQVVCKMELKTNRNMEVHGADGLHMSYDEARDLLNVYLGEAKLHQTVAGAVASVFESLERLHASGQVAHELRLVTNFFKHANEPLRERVSAYLDEMNPQGQVSITHACLIGYDWKEYGQLATPARTKFIAEFTERYREHGAELVKKVAARFAEFPKKHLAFEFFFVPFHSVEEFRSAFFRELHGGGVA